MTPYGIKHSRFSFTWTTRERKIWQKKQTFRKQKSSGYRTCTCVRKPAQSRTYK